MKKTFSDSNRINYHKGCKMMNSLWVNILGKFSFFADKKRSILNEAKNAFSNACSGFKFQKRFDEALLCIDKLHTINLDLNEISEAIDNALEGVILAKQASDTVSIEYWFNRAIRIAEMNNDIRSMIRILDSYIKYAKYTKNTVNEIEILERLLVLLKVDSNYPTKIFNIMTSLTELYIIANDYQRALEMFESIIHDFGSDEKFLTRASKIIFDTLLVYHVINRIPHLLRMRLDMYAEKFPQFGSSSQEYRTILQIIDAYKFDNPIDAFSTAIDEYDNLVKLTPIEIQLVSEIKNTFIGQVIYN